MLSTTTFLIFGVSSHDPLRGQSVIDDHDFVSQVSHTLWHLVHLTHTGGRRYFLHEMHLNPSFSVSGRLSMSTFGLESSDIMKPLPQCLMYSSGKFDNFSPCLYARLVLVRLFCCAFKTCLAPYHIGTTQHIRYIITYQMFMVDMMKHLWKNWDTFYRLNI